MELVYKKDGFITKLFACLFIAMFVVMCLVGNIVFATDYNTDDDGYILESSLAPYSELIKDYNYFVLRRLLALSVFRTPQRR